MHEICNHMIEITSIEVVKCDGEVGMYEFGDHSHSGPSMTNMTSHLPWQTAPQLQSYRGRQCERDDT